MKTIKLYTLGFGLSLALAACNHSSKTSNMASLTIEDEKIITSFFATPDSSINIEELKAHQQKFPERWKAAFDYLAKLDTANLTLGRVDLSPEVFVNIAEYETKTVDESLYESHKEYVDIQYVANGEEYIAVNNNIPTLKVTKPYDNEKDYMNYEYDGQKLRLANNKHFFIFFPTDAHMPCIKVGKKSNVKKLVIKLKYN